MQGSEASRVDRHVIVMALIVAVASTAIGTCDPSGFSGVSLLHGMRQVGWVLAQSFLVTVPGIAIALLFRRQTGHVALVVGCCWILAVPALMVLDAITFHWIGDRFLSASTWRVAGELRGGLMGYVTPAMITAGTLLLVSLTAGLSATWWISRRISQAWLARSSSPRPATVLACSAVLASLFALPSLIDFDATKRAMAEHSSRHPLCVLGLVSSRGVKGKISPADADDTASEWSFEQAVIAREHHQRQLAVDFDATSGRQFPDILIVVVESFRRELVTRDVMPNLWRYAQTGIHCRSHFSGGNATNHGMFSLVNGLESIWYEQPVRFTPLLNRLFREAGYELGFFAGHDDWRKFYMDGYINEDHFDVFQTSRPGGLASDRRATELASMFLDRSDSPHSGARRPRLALLYLYATHATYESYPDDQLFQPAADDRFLYPYSQSSQKEVWNRYKNSAHTVDRFLDAAMREDRVVLVTGDHGESFLEDGTIGHGIRISEFQNMTPAVIFVPRGQPRVIDHPTSHADLLPTLLSAAGIQVTGPKVFDGDDLLNTDDETLFGRTFVTRNYLHDDVAVIGPWTSRPDQPFAFRIGVSLRESKLSPLNAIDRCGNQQEMIPEIRFDAVLKQWSDSRFAR